MTWVALGPKVLFLIFLKNLKEYLNDLVSHPGFNWHASLFNLPFQHVDVYSQFEFHPQNILDLIASLIAEEEENDNINRAAHHNCIIRFIW